MHEIHDGVLVVHTLMLLPDFAAAAMVVEPCTNHAPKAMHALLLAGLLSTIPCWFLRTSIAILLR